MFRLLVPHFYVTGVEELTATRLRARGIDALLLDADGTLKRYRSEECTPEARHWLAEMRSEGIGLCLISNGLSQRINRFAASVSLPYVARAMKPMPWGCRRAMAQMGFDPASTAIVGDQMFADVLAGRLAGLVTIMVPAIHPEEEPWFTRLKRGPERRMLRRMERRGVLRREFRT